MAAPLFYLWESVSALPNIMINILKTLSFSERDNSGQIRISRPTRDDGFLKRLYLLPRWSRNDFFTVADAPHSPLLPEGSHIHHRHLPILIAAEILRWTENVYTVLGQVACAAVASTKKNHIVTSRVIYLVVSRICHRVLSMKFGFGHCLFKNYLPFCYSSHHINMHDITYETFHKPKTYL